MRLSRKVLLAEGEGTSPKYPGAGEAYNSTNPGGGDDRRGGDRDRGPRREAALPCLLGVIMLAIACGRAIASSTIDPVWPKPSVRCPRGEVFTR